MLIKIILIVLGVFVYLLIGGILDAHFDLGPAFTIWPLILIFFIPWLWGQNIYEWFEERRWKKLFGGEKE